MKNMKRLIMIYISIVMLIGTYSVYAETSDNNLIQDGTYIQIGKYWRPDTMEMYKHK